MSPMLNRILKALLPPVVLGVAAMGAYVMYLNRPPVETQTPVVSPPAVRVQRVAFESVDLAVSSQGTVQPRTASQLVPEISGTVINVSPTFAVGGFFEEGDVLLEIDPYDYQQALITGQSQLAQARLRLAQEEAEAEVARREWEELGRGDANALTLRQPQVEDARAAVTSAEAAIDRARRDLERAEVRAPYAGRVQSKDVDIGQFVNRGTAVGRIYAVDSAEVRLPLPDEELAYVDVPMSYRGTQPQAGPDVVLSADFAGRRFAWQGRIVRTEGEIDSVSRMVHVVAEVDDPYAPGSDPSRPPLAVGMFVEAEIAGRRVDDVVMLPWAALHGRDQVLIVDDDGRLRYRQVDILRSTTEYVLVRSGLAEGEQVSISALDAVIDGMAVQIAEDEPVTARAEADTRAPDRGSRTTAADPVPAPPAEPRPTPATEAGAAPPAGAPGPDRVAAAPAPRPDRPSAAAAPGAGPPPRSVRRRPDLAAERADCRHPPADRPVAGHGGRAGGGGPWSGRPARAGRRNRRSNGPRRAPTPIRGRPRTRKCRRRGRDEAGWSRGGRPPSRGTGPTGCRHGASGPPGGDRRSGGSASRRTRKPRSRCGRADAGADREAGPHRCLAPRPGREAGPRGHPGRRGGSRAGGGPAPVPERVARPGR